MIPIVCIENRYGMLFNKRRVSKDIELIKWLLEYIQPYKLWYNSYTSALFKDLDIQPLDNVICDEEFIKKAEEHDYCLIENVDITQYREYYNEIIVCKWNRDYPSDVKLNINESDVTTREIIAEIVGKSHKNITIELWKLS